MAVISINAAGANIPGAKESSDTALILRDNLSYSKLQDIGEALRNANRWSKWWLGDWWLYCEAHLGEEASQLLESTQYDEETLRSYAYVAERIEPVRRKSTLSWTHHRVVCSMSPEEGDEWLRRAENEDMSVKDLQNAIKDARAKKRKKSAKKKGPEPQPVLRAVADPDLSLDVGEEVSEAVAGGEGYVAVAVFGDYRGKCYALVGPPSWKMSPKAFAEFVLEATIDAGHVE